MIPQSVFAIGLHACVLTLTSASAVAAPFDWSTGGGDSARSGLSSEVGPGASTLLWDVTSFGSPGSPTFISGSRVFRVGVQALTSSAPSYLECHDLDTGALLWSVFVPYESSAHAAGRCLGVDHGRVYASRGEHILAFDAATGALAWTSTDSFAIDFWEDAAFTPEGDLILDTATSIHRVRGSDGGTSWTAVRPGGGTGGQGVALRGNVAYAHQSSGAGVEIVKIDLATGNFVATSGPLPVGSTLNTPLVGANDMVFAAYSSGAPGVLVALHDDGPGLSVRWTRPTIVAGATNLRQALGPDGSVHHIAPGLVVERLHPATGSLLASSTAFPAFGSYGDFRIVVDALGSVFVTNGSYSIYGMLLAFDRDLGPLWSATVNDVSFGGPAVGRDGTLVVAGGGRLVAYRVPRTPTRTICAGDGSAGACPCAPGFAGNGCASASQASGARLATEGHARVTADTLRLHAFQMPDSVCLFAQGTSAAAAGMGIPFGDGLRCVDGTVVRLASKPCPDGAANYPDAGEAPVSIQGAIPALAGLTRTYQVQYRQAVAFCTSATFNFSNGVTIPWSP